MKTIFIHDENSNEFLSQMFWRPLVAYAKDRGHDICFVTDPEAHHSNIVVAHGDRLSPERIQRIKNNGNVLVCFDINDSSYLSSSYIHSPEQSAIDLIFKISGIPLRNEISEVNLDRNFQVLTSQERYLPQGQWEKFEELRPRIKPLPYVLWHALNKQTRHAPDYGGRGDHRIMVRGGNHFWRVVLFLRLLEAGRLDYRSSFCTEPYFSDGMEKRFQFCDDCKTEKINHGRCRYDTPLRHSLCTNPSTCWHMTGEFFGGPMFGKHEHGYWNNRCPHSFMHLAKEFERCRKVELPHEVIEMAFNGRHVSPNEFFADLAHVGMYADLKWLNTINLPPRFWEAASVGTPSLYAKRVSDQSYWPHVEEGQHYFTYTEDMSEFPRPSPEQWTEVSRAVRDLYETKIKGTDYAVSNELLSYMLNAIIEVGG